MVGRILDSGCRLKTVVGFEFYLSGCTSYRRLQQVILASLKLVIWRLILRCEDRTSWCINIRVGWLANHSFGILSKQSHFEHPKNISTHLLICASSKYRQFRLALHADFTPTCHQIVEVANVQNYMGSLRRSCSKPMESTVCRFLQIFPDQIPIAAAAARSATPPRLPSWASWPFPDLCFSACGSSLHWELSDRRK